MSFARDILKIKEQLENDNHIVSIPPDTYDSLEKPDLNMDLDFCIQNDLLMRCFQRVQQNDAILVLNYEKNGVEGYIGGASLMEIAIAYYLRKKIFILNELPSELDLRYVCEIKQAKPIILDGNLKNLRA